MELQGYHGAKSAYTELNLGGFSCPTIILFRFVMQLLIVNLFSYYSCLGLDEAADSEPAVLLLSCLGL